MQKKRPSSALFTVTLESSLDGEECGQKTRNGLEKDARAVHETL
jgi:hypothetical protein